jgi:hypothetical protein
MDLLKKIKKPLGDDDIKKYLPEVKIITTEELNKIDNIDELFDNKKYFDYVIILFIDEPNSGHWTALLKYGDILEFFCPYGKKPNEIYNWVPKNIRKTLGTEENHLTKLFKKSKYKVLYNNVEYQEKHKKNININTCGRHCINRILQLKGNGYTLPEYYEYMKQAKKYYNVPWDVLITALINQ